MYIVSQNKKLTYRLRDFFIRYTNNFWRLIIVNLLFCIPLSMFTGISILLMNSIHQFNIYIIALVIPVMSPFFAALNHICKKVTLNQKIQPLKDFGRGIKNNWKFLLVNSLFIYIIGIGLWITFSFYRDFAGDGNMMITASIIISLIVAVLFMLMEFTIQVMAVSVELRPIQILKNSVFLIIGGFTYHLKTLISLFLVFCLLYTIVQISVTPVIAIILTGILTLLLLPVLIVYIIVFNSYQIVEKNVITPYMNEHKSPKNNEIKTKQYTYEELLQLSKGNPDEYVSVGGRMLKRSTVAKMADAHKNDIS